jgi:hypothetical protein
MAKATVSEIKKRKGRSGVADRGIASVTIMVRLSPETVAEIDRAMADFAKKIARMKGRHSQRGKSGFAASSGARL